MKYFFKITLSTVIFALGFSFASAQVTSETEDTIVSSRCVDLSYYMSTSVTRSSKVVQYTYKQSQDKNTEGEVSDLQFFLKDEGYLDRSVVTTGRYGPATRLAVMRFQKANGIAETGATGPLTRLKIKNISGCSTDTSQPVSATSPVMCTMEARLCPDGSVMPRVNCVWQPGKCPSSVSFTNQAQSVQSGVSIQNLCPDGSTRRPVVGPSTDTGCGPAPATTPACPSIVNGTTWYPNKGVEKPCGITVRDGTNYDRTGISLLPGQQFIAPDWYEYSSLTAGWQSKYTAEHLTMLSNAESFASAERLEMHRAFMTKYGYATLAMPNIDETINAAYKNWEATWKQEHSGYKGYPAYVN